MSESIDGKYGPYDSLDEFFNFVESETLDLISCITIAVKQTDGSYIEYWNNTSDINKFVKKFNSGNRVVLDNSIDIHDQMKDTDTVYELVSSFNLQGQRLNIPSKSTLYFNGGCITLWNANVSELCVPKINGNSKTISILLFNGVKIERVGDYPIFIGNTFVLSPGCDLRMSYFQWNNELSLDNFNQLQNLYNCIKGTTYNIVWDIPELKLNYNATIYLDPNKTYDFNNAKIYAHSLSISRYLFTVDYASSRTDITSTVYKKISEAIKDEFFAYKQGLIIVDDLTPLYERPSSGQIYKRRDILLVQNNELCNYPIFNYDDDPDTEASIKFLPITSGGFKFCNLHFDRTGAVNMTPLLWVNYCYKPEICNLIVDSSHREWDGYAESGTIRFEYVHSPYIHDISINNCYGDPVGSSSESHVSYNINITGGTNVIIERLNGNARWHSFGNQSINGAVLRDCIVDQWDSHTYGKDYLFENCTFHTDHLGQPEKGFMHFIHCKFLHSNIGYTSDSDIASFPIQKIFDGCTFEDQDKALVNISQIHTLDNLRQMLVSGEYPTLIVNNCILNIVKTRTTYVFYEISDKNTELINSDKLCNIYINNLTINTPSEDSLNVWLINRPCNVNICANGIQTHKGNIRLAFDRLKSSAYVQIERCKLRMLNIPTDYTQNKEQFTNAFSFLN